MAFSVPQIKQGNISPAASMLGNTTNALMSRVNQNTKSGTDLFKTLLGQAGTGIREKLQSRRTGELDTQKFERELPTKLIGAIPQLQQQKQNLLLQGGQELQISKIDELLGTIANQAFGLGGGSEGEAPGILPVAQGGQPIPSPQQFQQIKAETPEGQIPEGDEFINQGAPVQNQPLSATSVVGGQNLPLEEARNKTILSKANADPTIKREEERNQQFVINARTGIIASQPSAPGSQERENIVLTPVIFESQESIRKPDGTLNQEGLDLQSATSNTRVGTNEAIGLMKDSLRLDAELGLNMAEKGLLLQGGVDLLPWLDPRKKISAALLKNKFDRIEAIILKTAAEANDGRPTDKDYLAILKGFPELFSSREKFTVAGIEQIAALAGNLAQKELTLNNTAKFNAAVDQYQQLTDKKFEFNKPTSFTPEEIEIALNKITGGISKTQEAEIQTGEAPEQAPTQQAAPSQPAAPGQGDASQQRLKRLERLQKLGAF